MPRLRRTIRPSFTISRGGAINLVLCALAWFTGAARTAQHWLIERDGHEFPIRLWAILPPAFLGACAVLGTVQWVCTPRLSRDIARLIEHATIAFIGGSFLLICQTLMPKFWLLPVSAMLPIAVVVNRILFGTKTRAPAVIGLILALIVADFLLPRSSESSRATPVYLLWLAMFVTVFSAILPMLDQRLSWWLCGLLGNAEHESTRISTNAHESGAD